MAARRDERVINNKGTYHAITIGLLQLAHLSGHLYPKVNFIAVLERKKRNLMVLCERTRTFLACIAYIPDDFELDVLWIRLAWAGFGFLFLVAHGKVRTLVYSRRDSVRGDFPGGPGSTPAAAAAAIAARRDREDADCAHRGCLPDCRTSLFN